MKKLRCKSFGFIAVMVLLVSLFTLPACAAETVEAAQSRSKAVTRPVFTVVTQTTKADRLALRWETSDNADGYLLKYRKAGSGSWKRVWIRDADKSSYVLKNLNRSSYTVQLKAYMKQDGTYTYSKASRVTVNLKRMVRTAVVEEAHETYLLLSCLNQKGKQAVEATVSIEALGELKDTVKAGDTLLLVFQTWKESDPAQIDGILSIQKLK